MTFSFRPLTLALLLLVLAAVRQASGQTSDPTSAAIQLADPVTTTWEMGVTVSLEAGTARGIVATCPLPVDWPEQTIKVVEEQFSTEISKISYKTLDDAVRQLIITIPRLDAGQSVTAVVRVEVSKSWIEAPQDTTELRLPKRIAGPLRGYLQPSPYIESKDRRIRALSAELFSDPLPAWDQMEKVFDWVRDNVEYRFDEQIKSCLQALDDGVGDCEEMSSLFIAICRAAGVPARAVWVPGHTYPEFYLEDAEGNGHWYPCQVAGEGHDFGRMPDAKPILQKGDRFRITGAREPQRYVRPTLTAKDATGTPKIEWILRPVQP